MKTVSPFFSLTCWRFAACSRCAAVTSKVAGSGLESPWIIRATSSRMPRFTSRSTGNLSIERLAPTPLAPMPSGLLVAAAASSPPKSFPSRPICPIASMLAAEMLHLGGERKLAAVAEGAARVGVRGSEAKRIERIHRCDGRGDLPVVGEVDQARSLERAQKRLNLPRVVVGQRRRKLGQAKCGEGAREYGTGGVTVGRDTAGVNHRFGHGFSPSLGNVQGTTQKSIRA